MAQVKLSQQRDRDVSPHLHHSREQRRRCEIEPLVESHRKCNGLGGLRLLERDQMRVFQGEAKLVTRRVVQIDPEKLQKIRKFRSIDDAQTVELVNAGNGI